MMTAIVSILTGIMLIIGAVFAAGAALGINRLPDVYTRMHAASKAGTLGSGLMVLALGLYSQEWDQFMRAVATLCFILLTAPVSAHLIARAAYVVGYKPCKETEVDALSVIKKTDEHHLQQ
ncbi:Na(+)/H(+) antiporter subunit G1 [Pseudovibrio axinellae]|uniref:Na(+)/H(+) antiporter subunit G1 n=1 Tax=Pseudovibrio axinellae TaxID=989403 RepID=A0A166AE89_9HYPH|nr:monovalent cation/H(+) antiporter subunit G [Pseudovibrio axinellae]KZL20956.1 Na(+)/H(+) antiporter subunit G1 [Pseudovibrio axinellae]SEP81415.1 multicomponent Na+:H+ antiporter subunit G [Pseudovibrio axinellae]